MNRPTREYVAPWWAAALHSFPHLDLTFQRVNSSFSLEDPKYKESLMFWAAAPVIWLLVTLVVFLMYFCYRCCQHDTDKRPNVVCLKWTMAVLTLACCGAVGVGFYGNEEANKGIMYLSEAGNDAMGTIAQMKAKANHMQEAFNSSFTLGIVGLKRVYRWSAGPEHQPRFEELTIQAFKNAQEIFDGITQIIQKVRPVDFSILLRDLKDYNFYRNIGMLVVLGWLMILCLVLLAGIGSSSKCTLLLFCAFGIFSLVLCWMSTGLHLGVSVGIGDFCVEPHPFCEELASVQLEQEYVQYYVRCDHRILNPFRNMINGAFDKFHQSNKSLNNALSEANKHIVNETELIQFNLSASLATKGLKEMSIALMSLTSLVDCTNLHKDYNDALQSICYIALPGMLCLILSAAVTGLFFSVLVVLASKAWRSVVPKSSGCENPAIEEDIDLILVPNEAASRNHYRKSYLDTEEDDGPFIPRPSGSSPYYHSFPRGRQAAAHERVHSHQRSTPPPAYNSNEFYRQYSDVNPPDDYCGRETNA